MVTNAGVRFLCYASINNCFYDIGIIILVTSKKVPAVVMTNWYTCICTLLWTISLWSPHSCVSWFSLWCASLGISSFKRVSLSGLTSGLNHLCTKYAVTSATPVRRIKLSITFTTITAFTADVSPSGALVLDGVDEVVRWYWTGSMKSLVRWYWKGSKDVWTPLL